MEKKREIGIQGSRWTNRKGHTKHRFKGRQKSCLQTAAQNVPFFSFPRDINLMFLMSMCEKWVALPLQWEILPHSWHNLHISSTWLTYHRWTKYNSWKKSQFNWYLTILYAWNIFITNRNAGNVCYGNILYIMSFKYQERLYCRCCNYEPSSKDIRYKQRTQARKKDRRSDRMTQRRFCPEGYCCLVC